MRVMRTLLTVLLSSVLSISGNSQTAKVIALSTPDAATAKSLYEQRAELNKKIEEFEVSVKRKYLSADNQNSGGDSGSWNDGGLYRRVKSGWGFGEFEFSEDYRFIVPLQQHNITHYGSSLTCCNITTPSWVGPATGTFN